MRLGLGHQVHLPLFCTELLGLLQTGRPGRGGLSKIGLDSPAAPTMQSAVQQSHQMTS